MNTEPRVNTKWTTYLLQELQRLTRKTIGRKLFAPLNRHGSFASDRYFTLGKCSAITGHYIELLTKSCIFSSSASHLELLMTNLSGISLKKVYDSEPTLRTVMCAESALKSVLGDLTHTYFVGNAPMLTWLYKLQKKRLVCHLTRFFFKCSVVAASIYNINCEDLMWVTKDELLEFFPEQAEFFNKMINS